MTGRELAPCTQMMKSGGSLRWPAAPTALPRKTNRLSIGPLFVLYDKTVVVCSFRLGAGSRPHFDRIMSRLQSLRRQQQVQRTACGGRRGNGESQDSGLVVDFTNIGGYGHCGVNVEKHLNEL